MGARVFADNFISRLVDGWKDVPIGQRQHLLDEARCQTYRPGSREVKVLVYGCCLSLVALCAVFSILPMLLWQHMILAMIGVLPTVILFHIIGEALYIAMMRTRLKELVDNISDPDKPA